MSGYPSKPCDPAIARISAQIEALGREIGQMRKADTADRVRIGEALDRVEQQTRITNGRVTDLEKWRAREEGEYYGRESLSDRFMKRMSIILTIIAISVTATGVLTGIMFYVIDNH